MGRFALPLQKPAALKAGLVVALALLAAVEARAREVSGVRVPETRQAAGKTLVLNGAGLRTATMLGIKVYVAALYLPEVRRTAEEAARSPRPIVMDFTFVRAVDEKRADEAWRFQFKESVAEPYARMAEDVEALTRFFGPISKFGVQTFELLDGETRIYESGRYRGSIAGEDFQRAFLSIWTGPRPPTESLKRDLLGGK